MSPEVALALGLHVVALVAGAGLLALALSTGTTGGGEGENGPGPGGPPAPPPPGGPPLEDARPARARLREPGTLAGHVPGRPRRGAHERTPRRVPAHLAQTHPNRSHP